MLNTPTQYQLREFWTQNWTLLQSGNVPLLMMNTRWYSLDKLSDSFGTDYFSNFTLLYFMKTIWYMKTIWQLYLVGFLGLTSQGVFYLRFYLRESSSWDFKDNIFKFSIICDHFNFENLASICNFYSRV